MPETGLINLPLRVLGIENQTLNFVPIDYVVDGMLEISRRDDSAGGTYHLSNPVPTGNNFWLPNICRILHVEGIRASWRDFFRKDAYDQAGSALQRQMAFYYQYLQGEPRFDCRRALDALKNTGIQCPRVTVEFISKMMDGMSSFSRLKRLAPALLPIRAGFDVILLPLACIEWLSWTITPTIV